MTTVLYSTKNRSKHMIILFFHVIRVFIVILVIIVFEVIKLSELSSINIIYIDNIRYF